MKFFILTICAISFSLQSIAQITDDFTDGNFTTNPTWSGDNAKFIVDNQQLRSNSFIVSDQFYISTPSTLTKGDLEWQITVNMKFSTSGANYTDVYLMADSANLLKVNNGYFVRVGNTKDEVSLYKVVNGTVSQLTDGTDSKTHNKIIRIKVTKGAFGSWTLFADYAGGTNYTQEGTAIDNDITASSHFGVFIKQSSASFHGKHFFDDVYVGSLLVDKEAPEVTQVATPDDTTIRISVNEIPVLTSATFNLNNGYGTPQNIQIEGNDIILKYASSFSNSNYKLTINNLEDATGNSRDTIVEFTFFQTSKPKVGDLLITEIYADPTPSYGLPDAEYVEIYNASLSSLNLKNCRLSDGGTPATLEDYVLGSKAYLVLTKAGNESLFPSSVNVLGVSGFPALNNGGDHVTLANEDNQLIDDVNYSSDYYRDDIKEQGGYAIERIDFVTNCAEIENWTASNATIGGTPGLQNSVLGNNPDFMPPSILSARIVDEFTILLFLDENMASSVAHTLSNYTLVASGFSPISVLVNESVSTIQLTFSQPLEENTKHTLNIGQVSDCKGNSENNIEVTLVSTQQAESGDILFNELLFNPRSNGVDFIELYNNSNKYIDLSTLHFGYTKSDGSQFFEPALNLRILYPKQYLAITSDTAVLQSHYAYTEALAQSADIPPMSNDEGKIVIYTLDGQLIDSVHYNEDQHFELLSDVDGVSLEKISFSSPSILSTNWHSASSTVHFATPGYKNSQSIPDIPSPKSTFTLSSKTVSPDGDGYEDVLSVYYEVPEVGFSVNGYVYNLAGKLVSHAINNETIGQEGALMWDGILSDGTKIPIGNYILLLEAFNLEGKVIKKKLAFSVVSPF